MCLSSCSLAPDFTPPDVAAPAAYKEAAAPEVGNWKQAEKREEKDRGQWWKIFGDPALDDLEKQAAENNQSLKAAAARVEESRASVRASAASFLPNIDLGANAVRSKPASAGVVAFGGAPGVQLKPYTLYSAGATVSYEADLFGRVRDNEKALSSDADAQGATYRSVLLALQADVAQHYFSLRALDSERALLREAVKMREEARRIMQKRFEQGEAGEQDNLRTQSELLGAQAELLALDRQRAVLENALAVLLGKMPSSFTFAEAPLDGAPPQVPAGLPSSLLERRPDVSAAQSSMEAANARIGVARTAFFPSILLTASGGYESTTLGDLFKWSSNTWALGQMAGSALTWSIFDSGRNFARLDNAKAAYDEAVATYRQQVLAAFRDVEDALSGQRLLAEQAQKSDEAAAASTRVTALAQKRYDSGDINYFEVVDADRTSLATARSAAQTRGQRFIASVALIRALGGGWDEPVATPHAPKEATPPAPVEAAPATPKDAETPAPKEAPTPARDFLGNDIVEDKDAQ